MADVPGERVQGNLGADLLVVQTASYRTLYVFFFIAHHRREMVHFNVTASPTAAWIWRQVVEATPWRPRLSHLIHDRNAVYGKDFADRAARLGFRTVRTPPRSPKANAVAERLVQTLRSELLDHVIILNERHLSTLLSVFAG